MDFERATLSEDAVPEGICPACAGGAIFHRVTRTAAVYCQHGLTGAVLTIGRDWIAVRGIERHLFIAMVSRAIVKAELTRDVGEALERLMLEQASHSTKH